MSSSSQTTPAADVSSVRISGHTFLIRSSISDVPTATESWLTESDANAFLASAKITIGDEQQWQRLMEIMSECDQQDTVVTMQRVAPLLENHPELIGLFNRLLPEGESPASAH